MRSTYTKKYAWGNLAIRADFDQAASNIAYSVDGGEWDSTPFQVANATHQQAKAFALVNRWLKG